MARDYAKRAQTHSSKKSKKSSSGKQSPSGWVMLLFMVAIVGVVYIINDQGWLEAIKSKIPEQVINPTIAKNEKPSKPPELRFEFYTLLPKESVHVDSQPEQQTVAPPSIAQQQKDAASYVLQIASLKQPTEADALKAKLTLLGFDVFIEKYQNANLTWYRVKTGPYQTLETAEQARQTLQKNHYDSMLKRIG